MHGDHVVSGSWDRTAMLWNIVNGQCIRVLKHEMQVVILIGLKLNTFLDFKKSFSRLDVLP